jgi:hypothetical protein
MRQRRRRLGRDLTLFAAGAVFATVAAVAVGSFSLGTGNIRETSVSEGTSLIGLRPTGVGLPLIGVEGTVGAGDYAGELRRYHDSGEYERDLSAVGERALGYLKRRSQAIRRRAAKRCRRAKRADASAAAVARACRKPELGVVFDIDETTLSNYDCLATTAFTQATPALALCVAAASSPAIAPTKEIYDYALDHRIGVYFITGRPDSIPGARTQTEANLRARGFDRWNELVLAPSISFDTLEYKTAERARIEKQGVQIIANVGDQESDLVGGHADRAFKYPNPYYFIGE